MICRLADWLWDRLFGVTRWDRLTVDDALLNDPFDKSNTRGTTL